MFVDAIQTCSGFIRPVYTGVKTYGSDEIHNGLSTIIVLNNEGWFLTCRHIAEVLMKESFVNQNYPKLLAELNRKEETKKQKEERLKIKDDDVVILTNFVPVKDTNKPFEIRFIHHEYLDLTIGQIMGTELIALNYPVFSKSDPQPGQSLCKLGFPFPEFDCFKLNKDKTKIILKSEGNFRAPSFPDFCLMTRSMFDEFGKKTMFQMSSPGLKGHSGGPIFDLKGIVYGLQFGNIYLDADLDFNGEFKRGTKFVRINNQPVLCLGVGINSSSIREFLDANQVKYDAEE